MIIYAKCVLNMIVTVERTIVGLVFRTNYLTAWFETQSAITSVAWLYYCLFDAFRRSGIKFIIMAILVSLVAWYKIGALIVELILLIKK